MGSSSSIYMVELNDSQFEPLRKAIISACKAFCDSRLPNNRDAAYVDALCAYVEKAKKLLDLSNNEEGTFVSVNEMWFLRENRYAYSQADDIWANIITGALKEIGAKMHYITEVYY